MRERQSSADLANLRIYREVGTVATYGLTAISVAGLFVPRIGFGITAVAGVFAVGSGFFTLHLNSDVEKAMKENETKDN